MMDLSNIPAGPLPQGVLRPNFFDPPTKAPTIEALEGIFMGLMLLAVIVRLYVRTAITKQLGWDDCEIAIRAKKWI